MDSNRVLVFALISCITASQFEVLQGWILKSVITVFVVVSVLNNVTGLAGWWVDNTSVRARSRKLFNDYRTMVTQANISVEVASVIGVLTFMTLSIVLGPWILVMAWMIETVLFIRELKRVSDPPRIVRNTDE